MKLLFCFNFSISFFKDKISFSFFFKACFIFSVLSSSSFKFDFALFNLFFESLFSFSKFFFVTFNLLALLYKSRYSLFNLLLVSFNSSTCFAISILQFFRVSYSSFLLSISLFIISISFFKLSISFPASFNLSTSSISTALRVWNIRQSLSFSCALNNFASKSIVFFSEFSWYSLKLDWNICNLHLRLLFPSFSINNKFVMSSIFVFIISFCFLIFSIST